MALEQLSDLDVGALFMKVTGECWHAPANLGWLFEQVMETWVLYCGCLMSEGREAAPQVIFDCEEPALVFKPVAQEACAITGPVQPRLNPISWGVSLSGEEEGRSVRVGLLDDSVGDMGFAKQAVRRGILGIGKRAKSSEDFVNKPATPHPMHN